MDNTIEKNTVLTIAEKYCDKIFTANGRYSVRTVRAIAKECGVNKDMLSCISLNHLGDLYIVDEFWDPTGGGKLAEAFSITNYIVTLKSRFNSYNK